MTSDPSHAPNPSVSYPLPVPDDLPSLFTTDHQIERRQRTLVMGIVNVTPDSFSDGGRFLKPEPAVDHARRMIDDGADILDIGGESTRPGSEPVSEEEELRRVLPVLEQLLPDCPIPISIDTTRSTVASAAVDRGVKIVNDVSGLRADPAIVKTIVRSDAFLVIMHSRATPKTMQSDTHYDDLIGEVKAFLTAQAGLAMRMGVRRERIVIDPGIGFGKEAVHNLELLRRQAEFLSLGYPVLIGASRKSFLGILLGGAPPMERLEGTAATVALAVAGGARIVRVHDVREMARVARIADAICRPATAV